MFETLNDFWRSRPQLGSRPQASQTAFESYSERNPLIGAISGGGGVLGGAGLQDMQRRLRADERQQTSMVSGGNQGAAPFLPPQGLGWTPGGEDLRQVVEANGGVMASRMPNGTYISPFSIYAPTNSMNRFAHMVGAVGGIAPLAAPGIIP